MTDADLIPRSVLFGSPERANALLSPDGTRLLWLAPVDGQLAVWVRTSGADDARVVARDPARPIRTALWSRDGARVLYLQDAGGNENFHLFAATLDGAEPIDLTPDPDVRAGILDLDDDRPDTAIVILNERDRRLFDVHRLSLGRGTIELDTENPGDVAGWDVDGDGIVRAAIRANPDGSYDLLVRDAADAAWRTLLQNPVEDGIPAPVGFTPDGGSLDVITSAGANAKRLVRYDVATGTSAVLLEDPVYDVADVLRSRRTKGVIAAAVLRDRKTWHVLDADYADDFATLRREVSGELDVAIADRDDEHWIVTSDRDDASPSFWHYRRSSRSVAKLFDARPALAQYRLAPMEPVSFPARDGLTLHGYLTRPRRAAAGPVPAVLLVHGGPWARDVWGFNPFAQLLSDRGYAVLQVNFRGSTGYGKAFLNAGDRQWAGTMRTDLLDAKDWLLAGGIAAPGKVAIFGGSYGGYAVLTALSFTPDAFACGVDIVGPSNLNTLLASIPPYWHVLRGEFERRMGDDEATLNPQSPLFRAGDIRAPLLIAQGANDPRVKMAESDQIVAAMRERALPVTYLVFEDEGHGFAREDNRLRFIAAMENFLADHLGGRAEPAGADEDAAPYLR